MTEKAPASTTFIFVDRRKTGKGKSLPNRQKLLKRIKDSIRNAKPEDIDAGGGLGTAGTAHHTNPVKVARDALSEPSFTYDYSSGEREVILPGNDRWLKGDEFPIDGDGDGDGSSDGEAGQGENGEDDFVINISRNEFFDVFFSDCELPDLQETHEKDLPEAVMKPAGFQKDGNPGQLSVIRSFKNSIGRRKALTIDSREELEAAQLRLDDLMLSDLLRDSMDHDEWTKEVAALSNRIAELKQKIASVPYFEKVDHRYRKQERVLVKTADAVLMMLMDISGSMTEDRKRTARKFFSLQYAFIKRSYPQTDLVFIYHTDDALEVTEEEFFTSRVNGGTTISPAFALANKIVKSRYDALMTNVYLSYAGDGDNWDSDNAQIMVELEDHGLLSKIRHCVYVQVGSDSWGAAGAQRTWNTMKSIASGNKKLHLSKIVGEGDVFKAFKDIYGKNKAIPK